MKDSKTYKAKILFVLQALCLAVSVCGAGCVAGRGGNKPWKPGEKLPKEKVKLAVLYIADPLNEPAGYSYAHEKGIQNTQKELDLKDEQIIRKYHVVDTDRAEIENAIRDCIAEGANIIIATSWGFGDACEKLAVEFPAVVFAHASGHKRNDTNFTNYFGRIYLARYLSGIAAGMKTQSGRIGYVAAKEKSNSEETGGLNAFALGVEKANPAARIHVRVIYNWYDPAEETIVARSLIAAGCDVIAQGCDSANPQLEAAKAGVWGIGYNTDMGIAAGTSVITSAVWNWQVYYTHLVKSVMDGSFTTQPYFGGITDGLVDITPLSELAAPGTADAVQSARNRMINEGFNVFDGLLVSNDGKTIGEAGSTLADSEITGGMNWYYRNIVEGQGI
jgi:basic membrane protein A